MIQAYGTDKAGLLGCGITVATRAPRSGATNAIAAAKAAETRKVNGTGKKAAAPAPSAQVLDANGQLIGQPGATHQEEPHRAQLAAPEFGGVAEGVAAHRPLAPPG